MHLLHKRYHERFKLETERIMHKDNRQWTDYCMNKLLSISKLLQNYGGPTSEVRKCVWLKDVQVAYLSFWFWRSRMKSSSSFYECTSRSSIMFARFQAVALIFFALRNSFLISILFGIKLETSFILKGRKPGQIAFCVEESSYIIMKFSQSNSFARWL